MNGFRQLATGTGTARSRTARKARTAAWEAERTRRFRGLVRIGFVARAVTYGVIGLLTFALALGAGSTGAAPNQEGALGLIARVWLGRVALIVIAAGLLAYAL